jgi:hypothetical protein
MIQKDKNWNLLKERCSACFVCCPGGKALWFLRLLRNYSKECSIDIMLAGYLRNVFLLMRARLPRVYFVSLRIGEVLSKEYVLFHLL